MSSDRLPFDESFLKEKLKSDPTTWETRRQLAHGLYDKQAYAEAAEIIWTTDEIPSTDLDLAFAIRILAKAQPRRAIRLLTAVLELNQGKAVQNMAMANALLHHGMVLQAARFYGAALEADPTMVNPDLEHFVLWSDDESTMWGLFEKHRPKLGELPWMLRDPKEALRLTSRISLHTTPISVPELPVVPGEVIKHDLYQQEATHNAKITPPPAVTIPIDRVSPKDRLFDSTYGATVVASPSPAAAQVSEESSPSEAKPEPAPAAPAVVPIAPPARLAVPDSPSLQAEVPVAAVPVAQVIKEEAQPTEKTIQEEVVAAPLPAPVGSFPAKVVFPDSTKPTTSVVASEPVPAAQPVVAQPVVAQPEPVSRPAVLPFFADLAKPAAKPDANPSPTPTPFFADPEPAANSLPAASAEIVEKNEPEVNAVAASEKAATETDPFKISQSSVPTTLLRVKWSTPPARPGGGSSTPPVSRPLIPPIAQPVAPTESTPAPIPAATLLPNSSAEAVPQQAAPTSTASPFMPIGAPTGPATRPLVPTASPTGAPTRVLLPGGSPTSAASPSTTPPEKAAAPTPPPRRFLFFPGRANPPSDK